MNDLAYWLGASCVSLADLGLYLFEAPRALLEANLEDFSSV